ETPGIYAKAVGVNGKRAAIIDFAETDPEGWSADQRPVLAGPNDIILYELHVRDITSHPSAGSSYPKKFLGLVETGTKSLEGLATGIDHIKEMGVTHVHLLPSYDFLSVNEADPKLETFNWGYDPQNYSVPEGSYATDPFDPMSRIREFKQMVKGFHDNGIRVILDVVYNHTGVTENSNFNLSAPGYYYRHNEDGSWSDASACGNETASERPMMRRYMLESLKWWVEEYHLDGFRFDLMAIHDIETMNEISKELKAIEPSLFLYGEGWTAGGSPLPDERKAVKANAMQLDDVAVFCDDLRDGIKGSVFEDKDGGWLSGKGELKESIKFGVVAATEHPQIDYSKVNYSKAAFSPKPVQTINYVSCHDNNTLYDKLNIANEGLEAEDIQQMHRLANAIVLTSQGVPFLHAGVEMMRSKGGEHNSYNLPDAVNQIDWSAKKKYADQ
ncbi:MAG: type I pullulanase, partial [Bacteroidota bacterium]